MATKRYCSYCFNSRKVFLQLIQVSPNCLNYFDMDTGKFPIRYTCDLHKKRITGNEAETCPDYKRRDLP